MYPDNLLVVERRALDSLGIREKHMVGVVCCPSESILNYHVA